MRYVIFLWLLPILAGCSSYNDPSDYRRLASQSYYSCPYYPFDDSYYGSRYGGSYYSTYYNNYYEAFPTNAFPEFQGLSYIATQCDGDYQYIGLEAQVFCTTRERSYYAAFCAGYESSYIPGSAHSCYGKFSGHYYASRCAGYYSSFIPLGRRLDCGTYYASRCASYYGGFIPASYYSDGYEYRLNPETID